MKTESEVSSEEELADKRPERWRTNQLVHAVSVTYVSYLSTKTRTRLDCIFSFPVLDVFTASLPHKRTHTAATCDGSPCNCGDTCKCNKGCCKCTRPYCSKFISLSKGFSGWSSRGASLDPTVYLVSVVARGGQIEYISCFPLMEMVMWAVCVGG